MQKHRWIFALCLLLITLVGVMPHPVLGFQYIHYWRVTFSGSIFVGGNQSYPIQPFWTYVSNQSWQTCEQQSFELWLNNQSIQPLHLEEDSDGNPQLVLNITSQLQPDDILYWTEEWFFIVNDRRPSIPYTSLEQSGSVGELEEILGSEEYHRYTRGTTLWKTWNDTLINLATDIQNSLPEVQRSNVLALTYAAINWIQLNIQLATTIIDLQYPEETLRSRVGDCDDQSNLLIALLRILGIPSYLMTGHWFQEGARTSGFIWGSVPQDAYLYADWKNVLGHGWAMVFVPPWGWLAFDPLADPQRTDPTKTYYDSLYAKGPPLVTLWQIVASDYIAERRNDEADLFEYQLHRTDIEEWNTLGSIPILDLPYLLTNAATLIALTLTLAFFSCFVGFAVRRHAKEEPER